MSIRPIRETNDRVIFMIPAAAKEVRIVSRIARPSDAIGPFVDDRRDLGVLVGEVSLFGSSTTTALTRHLADAALNGWHKIEGASVRWTAGDAVLPVDVDISDDGHAILAIQVLAAGPYLAETAELRRAG